jgi:DNA-binding MarR family transcriptional regulator
VAVDDHAGGGAAAGAQLLPELACYVSHLLRRAYLRAGRVAPEFGPLARGSGSARDFQVLDALAEPSAAYSQQDLGERLGINRTTMVKLIDRLEDTGQVMRSRKPGDRRSYVLALTDGGREALRIMEPAMAAGDDRLTAGLDPAERNRLDALLGSLLRRPPAPPGRRHTSALITQSHHFVRHRIEDALAGAGLQTRHFGALAALDAGSCSQQRLARRLGVSEQAALQMVDDLERAGRVVRDRDPLDRRRYALRLTAAGQQALDLARRVMEAAEAEVAAALGPDGRAELRALLTKLLRADV